MKEYTLDLLNKNSVSVKTTRYTENGERVGSEHRKSYINSVTGREAVKNELPQAQQNAIFSIWGDTPTIDENDE